VTPRWSCGNRWVDAFVALGALACILRLVTLVVLP
jgi:hypothetical protein